MTVVEHPPVVEPVETKWARLGDVADINPKWNPLASKEDPVSFVGMAQMSDELGCVTGEEQRLVQEVRTGYTAFEQGDLLVAKITPCFENGKIGHANITNKWGAGSTEFHVVRPGDGLDPAYALHFLRRQEFRTSGKLRMTGSGGQQRVPASYVADTKIPLPPLPEQRRIAVILDKADHLRTQRREALAHLDALTQSIFHEMFGDLDPDGTEWPVLPIGEVCSVIVDCVNRTAPLADAPTPYKMIRTSNVRNRTIDLSGVRFVDEQTFMTWNRRATPSHGDVVLTREAPMGEAGIVPPGERVFLGQRTMLYRPNPFVSTAEYLLHYLTGDHMQREYERNGSGTTVKHLSVPYCRTFDVSIPPLELQQTFATRVAAVERLKEKHRAQLAELDTLFASLQHRAFKGEL